jgi:ABC-type Na+ efflux pump permease subunit
VQLVIDSATSDYIELNELRTEVLVLKQEASGHRTREEEQAATQEQQLLASQQGARLAWTEVQDAVAVSNELQERLTATEQDIKKIGKLVVVVVVMVLLLLLMLMVFLLVVVVVVLDR